MYLRPLAASDTSPIPDEDPVEQPATTHIPIVYVTSRPLRRQNNTADITFRQTQWKPVNVRVAVS